ncbi:DUF4199 domain-containing protein [Olivibacter sitiensis]|uniref:DUF4199 domain-containing protein n=1 Tax=Olivibacter sitiensis TaxID=376470 RepID=UPI0003FD9FE8|nr:DUF4199 domain-containing protein [Olivibacter sitiensis]
MEIKKQIRNTGLLYGAVLGVVLLLLAVLPMYYYLSSDSLYVLVFGPMVTGFMCTLALVIVFGFRLRKKIGGYWDFRQAATGLFFMLLVATVILVGGGYVFDNYVAPDVKDRFNEKRIALSISEMEKSGASKEELEKHIAKIDEQKASEGEVSLQSVLLNIPIYVICIFVFSLLFALLLKREKPRYYNSETGELISPNEV